ncbi:MAG: hypothetical protein AAGJ08_15915 [Cyanobacteria bacterium P01_H01_bin.35]
MQMSKNIKGNQPQFLNGWTEAVFRQGIVFIAPFSYRKEDVIAIYNQHEDWFILLATKWSEVRLIWSGAKRGIRIIGKKIMIKELGKSLIEIYGEVNPQFITDMNTNEVIWMNQAAIVANSNQPMSKIVGQQAKDLWQPGELNKMLDFLDNDLYLPQFEVKGYRLLPDGEKEKYTTLNEYRIINAFGRKCRWSRVNV